MDPQPAHHEPLRARRGTREGDSDGLARRLGKLSFLIELAGEGTDERVVLENVSNHLQARGVPRARAIALPGFDDVDESELAGALDVLVIDDIQASRRTQK